MAPGQSLLHLSHNPSGAITCIYGTLCPILSLPRRIEMRRMPESGLWNLSIRMSRAFQFGSAIVSSFRLTDQFAMILIPWTDLPYM